MIYGERQRVVVEWEDRISPKIELYGASIKSYQIRASAGDWFQAVDPQIPDLS